jgi:formylglycine-generating enzyme required for sulfatase activity
MKKLGYFLLLLPLLFAFGKNKKPQHSKYLTKHYVKVPAGKIYMHPNDINYIRANKATELGLDSVERNAYLNGLDSCSEFYILSTEVTNWNWKEFLYYLKQQGKMDEYNANLPDTTVWRHHLVYNEPYVDYYFRHKAYSEYPVVGINLTQAKAYANWLTDVFIHQKEGAKITFSVPTKKQWIRAARSESTTEYPWEGQYMRNSKGSFLANFKTLDERFISRKDLNGNYTDFYQIYVDDNFMDNEMTITSPAESYYPNQFGIYNMSGNVAELVSDDTVAMGGSWNDTGYDVRVESEQPTTEPRSTIGFRVVAVIDEL